MIHPEAPWLRVNRERPCPICGRFDWCLVAADGSACICPRTESAKRCGDGGYLHKLTDVQRPREPRRVVLPIRPAPPDLTPMALDFQRAAAVDRMRTFASYLGVRTTSLVEFGVGWDSARSAWTFPMRDPATGTVTGIRMRTLDGGKFSVRGGKEALFMADEVADTDEVLLVCEGASDAIASHSVGFVNAVGRPSCSGGTAHVVSLVKARKPSRLVIVADSDEPGTRGAEALASVLAIYHRDVRVIAPPAGVKDVREWIGAGATRHDIERVIAAADVRRLNMTLATKCEL